MHFPPRLKPGDTVGIFSPSSPISHEAVQTMVRYFEDRGYLVKVAPNTLAVSSFMAGTPEQRAGDFNLLARDPSVRMIMTSMGGASAVHLLPLIDYAALAEDPKIVVGLSDPSILLLAITQAAGIATFHGPNGVEFGGLVPLTPFCEENFWTLIRDTISMPFSLPIAQGSPRVLRGGPPVEGRLMGGNLGRLRLLIGTPWQPDWAGTILFIEELFANLPETDGMLAQLRLAGMLDQISGLIVGQPCETQTEADASLEEILLRNCAGFGFPIVMDTLIGHTDDKLTLPLGCRARLETAPLRLELLESPTCS